MDTQKIRSVLMLLLLSVSLFAQTRHTVNGYIVDAESGERLIGASVYDTISHRGVVTNNSGFYSLTLAQKEVALQVSYVGYLPSQVMVMGLVKDTMVNFQLSSQASLQEVTVLGHHSISGPQSAQMSAVEIPVAQLKMIPMLAGESDVLKAIQLLPGVQSGTEGSAGIYVRGGGPDENLVILDGVPLYNVNHLLGFFSVFNADAIKNVTLYKGNFPSQYGGRLSSIIDVRQNDGNTEGYHGNLSVGMIAAKLNVEGPIPHKKDSTGTTTFNISARRTYMDALYSPLISLAANIASEGDVTVWPTAYFYDVNAKLTHTFSNQDDKLSGSFYMGDDALAFSTRVTDDYDETNSKLGMRTMWGNLLAAINWEHRISPRMFVNTQLSYTRYRYFLRESLESKSQSEESMMLLDQRMEYNSTLRDVQWQTNFAWTPIQNNTLNYGVNYTYHQFQPSVSNSYLFLLDESMPDLNFNVSDTLNEGTMHGHEVGVYAEDSWSPWEWLKMNIGLRGSLYAIDGKVYPSIEPRVGLRALLYKDLAIKASYSYTTQYVHMLSNTSISLPTDLWVPVTKNIKPMHSMIVALGLSYNIMNQVEASVEGYYKHSTNLLEYKDGASFFGSKTSWQDKVAMGDGWSYGVELLLQRKVGPVTGWIGYTWSRTMRLFNREGQEINYGRPFHAKYDREHDLSIVLQYQINHMIDLSGTFVYGTGTRATLASQNYYDPVADKEINYISERNNYKMPDYHRLDLGINFHFPNKYSTWAQLHPSKKQQCKIWNDPESLAEYQEKLQSGKVDWLKNSEHMLSVNVYNVYCRKNPYLMIPQNGGLQQVSLFPVIPSISYSFKF